MNRRTGVFIVIALILACFAAWRHLNSAEKERVHKTRTLLEDGEIVECIPSGIGAFPGDFLTQEQRKKGGFLIHFAIFFYTCAMIAVVCDEYFVPALESITRKLDLSPDVAGATFMAMGASAPELFSSIAGSFIVEDDIGIGTILGSAVFNVLFIPGVVGVVLWKKALDLQTYPIVRDSIVYGVTVLVLSVIISDNLVSWWEALILLCIFAAYITLMHFNPAVERLSYKAVNELGRCCYETRDDSEKSPLLNSKDSRTYENCILKETDICTGVVTENGYQLRQDKTERSLFHKVWHVLMWLPGQLFYYTIPPVQFYPATFTASIVWMGAMSYIAVWMVTIIGYTFSIPDSVSGLTVLAAGSSVPDLVATVVIAKSGEGNMAISNLLGSNTFDLAFCLGSTWLIKSLISARNELIVYSSAMTYTAGTLLVTLLALFLTFLFTRWRLSRTSGLICLSLYVVCITMSCLYELNVFAPINKPTCF